MAALDCSGIAKCCACLTGGKARRTSDELDAKAMFEMKVLEKRQDEKDDWRCYWDRFGVMRRERAPMRRDGKDFKHKPHLELAVMHAKTRDFFDPGDEVFLLHLEWLNQWLRFAVHGASTPGPISNSVLVTSKQKVKKKAKYNLHWRPVSKEIWDFLLTGGSGGGGYGGGPGIKFIYEGDAPLVGKDDIADYMTKTKIFKLAEVDFVIPETIEDDGYDRDAYEPSASLLVRDSELFPPWEGDNSPPPYANPLADAEQERRSGGGSDVDGASTGLINPLHSGAGDGAGHDRGPTSPMHGMQPAEGILLSMDDSDGPGAAPPPSDDEGTLSDSEVDDDDDDDEGFTSVATGSNGAAHLAGNDSDEDDEFVQAGPVHAPQRTPPNPRAKEDLFQSTSPLHTPQHRPPQAQSAPSNLDDVDDANLLDFDDDDDDDDDEMDDFRDASAPVVSQEIAEHELDDI